MKLVFSLFFLVNCSFASINIYHSLNDRNAKDLKTLLINKYGVPERLIEIKKYKKKFLNEKEIEFLIKKNGEMLYLSKNNMYLKNFLTTFKRLK